MHISYLTDDYYHYDDRHQAMIGERTGKIFRIGDEVRVRVISTNIDERAVDFEIVGMDKQNQKEKEAHEKSNKLKKTILSSFDVRIVFPVIDRTISRAVPTDLEK